MLGLQVGLGPFGAGGRGGGELAGGGQAGLGARGSRYRGLVPGPGFGQGRAGLLGAGPAGLKLGLGPFSAGGRGGGELAAGERLVERIARER